MPGRAFDSVMVGLQSPYELSDSLWSSGQTGIVCSPAKTRTSQMYKKPAQIVSMPSRKHGFITASVSELALDDLRGEKRLGQELMEVSTCGGHVGQLDELIRCLLLGLGELEMLNLRDLQIQYIQMGKSSNASDCTKVKRSGFGESHGRGSHVSAFSLRPPIAPYQQVSVYQHFINAYKLI